MAKNIIKYPLTVCFSAFILLVFVLYFALPDREMSEWENRYLSSKPELKISDVVDGSFMEKYEDYINDQIPFRDGFIKVKAVGEMLILKCENNGIVRGKDSYLFTKGSDDTLKFDKNIQIISQFIDEKASENRNIIVAIAPNASGVLNSKVPKGVLMPNQAVKLDEMYSDNSLLKGARVVDLKCVLKAHEDEYIYYRTDHHWTTYGAYLAYHEISENPVELSELSECFGMGEEDGFLGTLYAKYKGMFVKPDVITYYDIPVKSYKTDDNARSGLLDKTKLSVFDKYGMFLYGNFGRCDIESIDASDDEVLAGRRDKKDSLIIIKDSYANCLVPFLTFDYKNITLIDLRYYNESVTDLLSEKRDADILFINNFDFLNEDNHFYKLVQ